LVPVAGVCRESSIGDVTSAIVWNAVDDDVVD